MSYDEEQSAWFTDRWYRRQWRSLEVEPRALMSSWDSGLPVGEKERAFVEKARSDGRVPCSLSVNADLGGSEGMQATFALLRRLRPLLPERTAVTTICAGFFELWTSELAGSRALRALIAELEPVARPTLGAEGQIVAVYYDDDRDMEIVLHGAVPGGSLTIESHMVSRATGYVSEFYLSRSGLTEMRAPQLQAAETPWSLALFAPEPAAWSQLSVGARRVVLKDAAACFAFSLWTSEWPLFELEPGRFPLGLLVDEPHAVVEQRLRRLCVRCQMSEYTDGEWDRPFTVVASGELPFRYVCAEAHHDRLGEQLVALADNLVSGSSNGDRGTGGRQAW